MATPTNSPPDATTRDSHGPKMPVTKQTELEQYALKCSREKPKCVNCQGWSGPCTYSRRGRIPRRPRTNILQDSVNNHTERSLDSSHVVESIVHTLPTSSTTHESTYLNLPNYESDKDIMESNRSVKSPACNGEKNEHINDDSSAPSILSQAKSSITTAEMKSSNLEPGLQRDAENGLSYLTTIFSEGSFDDPDIYSNVKHFRRQREVFFIPDKAEGDRMIQIFIAGIERGKPFFTMPPLDIIPKLAFEPKRVSERAWLLLYNAFLSTTIAFMEPSNTRINRGLQWNVWIILQDSSFFLEPSEIGIQAILMVSCHSQDVVPPGLCWTLISHACRMAQSLNLHIPSPKYPKKSKENSHRNCLFWNLFMIDKSLSLAYGRPPFLLSQLYEGIDPPDLSFLATFRPHRPSTAAIGTPDHQLSDGFGALYFGLARELFVLQGKIIDIALVVHNGEFGTEQISSMKERLETWKVNLDDKMSAYSNFQGEESEIQSVQMGINFLTFQYHHSVVYLTRSSKHNHELCLFHARIAIDMLEKLVSSSLEVFNGIVWQLLYYPFMPYFVLFSNIIADPNSPSCFDDLQSLRKVVYYFLRMHVQHRSARKLEKIAETFTRLAESFVRGSMSRKALEDKSPEINVEPLSRGSEMTTHITGWTVPQIPRQTGSYPPGNDSQNANTSNNIAASIGMDLRDLSGDLTDPTLLSFLSYPMDPSAFNTEMAEDNPLRDINSFTEQGRAVADPLLHQLDFLSTEQSLDGHFDWFSWDSYAWNAPTNGF
ncbi:hypothetical protein BPAE_0017g00800 [Botrytis paeoniae]|uniref:Xylanolytic transcriptional activator regulatory domain-containing protein n=1 Tax=Botrytis paeoniae TaxID=278948 RepID=A0A4Z1G1N5_9HELO|nr:hypothetical protein BPAE_0017g00800 [Botrytis paeoniae]